MKASIKTILVPVEHSDMLEATVRRAVDLARTLEARVILLQVTQPPMTPLSGELSVLRGERIAVHRHTTPLLRELEPLLDGVSHQVEVVDGVPEHAIVNVAQRLGADLILMATHAREGLPRLLSGSVTEYVVQHAPCPVMVTSPHTLPV